MKKVIDAEKMLEDTERMRQVADGITIDGIEKYIKDNAVDYGEKEKLGVAYNFVAKFETKFKIPAFPELNEYFGHMPGFPNYMREGIFETKITGNKFPVIPDEKTISIWKESIKDEMTKIISKQKGIIVSVEFKGYEKMEVSKK